MFNRKIIIKIIGLLLCMEAVSFLLPIAVSFYYEESDWREFLYSFLVTAGVGSIMIFTGRRASRHISHRDGICIVVAAWLAFTIFGMLPMLFTGATATVTDAFLEMMSGFSTTGASVIDKVDSLSHSILFWRSLTHFIGGLGIIVLTIAILPALGVNEIKLSESEQLGPLQEKIHPRVKTTSKYLLFVYLILNISCIVMLYLCGMNWFDACCYAFSICATGGLAPHSVGLIYFKSQLIEYVACFFMFACAMNFVLFYLILFKGQIKRLFTDIETKWYVCIILITTGIVMYSLYETGNFTLEESFRYSLFQIVSSITTSGLSITNTMTWPPMTFVILGAVMLIGGCTHSTAGGLKIMRLILLWKITINEINYRLHPHAVFPVKVGHTIIHNSAKIKLLSFVTIYFVTLFLGIILLSVFGVDLADSFSVSIAAIANGGAIYGHPHSNLDSWAFLPVGGKWVASMLMLLGRLEIFTVLMFFSPKFWKGE